MSEADYESAIGRLRQSLGDMKGSDVWKQIVEPRDGVFTRFQPLLDPAHIPNLSDAEIRPFFYFENNHHWTSLYRQVNRVCSDMPVFRQVLLELVDETVPIASRLDSVIDRITGLGKGIVSALLLIAFPDRYGVWNNTSEAGLVALNLFPAFERGTKFGAKYERINALLNRIAGDLGIDLWTLDALWWHLSPSSDETAPPPAQDKDEDLGGQPDGARFGLERHLHEFLRDNWDHVELGREWAIYSEHGEPEKGYEYVCPVGRIDLLAQHRDGNRWLVIELKRERSSDVAVGQVLRYVGWVQEHLAKDGETVEGLIISRFADDRLHYATRAAPAVRYMTYEVEFRLKLAAFPDSGARP